MLYLYVTHLTSNISHLVTSEITREFFPFITLVKQNWILIGPNVRSVNNTGFLELISCSPLMHKIIILLCFRVQALPKQVHTIVSSLKYYYK
jgi:hypothetical protein